MTKVLLVEDDRSILLGLEKNLRFEITFPDNARSGLHQTWQFTRSIVIQVDPRR